jgi:serine/threonine protein kinase
MRKILKAVHHMHDNEIMHRDIKFDNILLRYNEDIKSIKLIDLGLAIDINKKMLT